jgi:arylsulfatase A-like enzyme
MVQLEEHFLAWTSLATTHGSVYRYDTHVPWLLRLPSGAGGVVTAPVFTVDVAPTLARLVGLSPPDDLDGVDRTDLLGPIID